MVNEMGIRDNKNIKKSINNQEHVKKGIFNRLFEIIKLHKKITIIILAVMALSIPIGIVVNYNFNRNKETNQKNICIVQFDSAGGTLLDQYEFKCGDKIEKPVIIPEKVGFQFIEWSYLNQPFDFNENVDENIILVANYRALDEEKIVVVSFDSVGGSAVRPIEVLINSTISAPLDPNKNGYVFKGWYLNDKKFDFKKEIKENITLKAKWEKSKDSASNNSSSSNNGSAYNSNNTTNTSNKYKCIASYYTTVGENKVTTDYNDHVNWTFSTGISYSPNDCYITYKSADNSVATVSDSGMIKALKKGTTYIYECINDNETKKEVGCYKGKLNVVASQFEEEKEKALNFFNSINGYYWYLDGDSYAYLYPTIIDWYDHTLVNWDSKYISLKNNSFVTSSSTGVMYQNDTNIHNYFLANPTELGYHVISQYSMKVSGSKLYITVGGKTYSFTKNTTQKGAKVSLSLSSNNLTINKGSSSNINVNVSSSFLNHNISSTSSNFSIASCNGNSIATNGNILFTCYAYKPGTAVITFKDNVGGNSTSLNINVNNVVIPVTGITLNETNINLVRGNSITIVATVLPTNADDKSVSWSTSNSSVATVSNGKVIAVGAGSATITATTIDGNKSVTCTVNVTNPALTANASIGISTVATNAGITRGINVSVSASGGTGIYNYYYIKLYKDGKLIGQTTNTNSNSLFVTGHSNGSYYAEIEVHDSAGTVFTTTSGTSTISGF